MDNHHPAWRISGNIAVLTIILWMTSSNFDETEMRAIILALLGNGFIEKLTR
jgi:hypothetical protein